MIEYFSNSKPKLRLAFTKIATKSDGSITYVVLFHAESKYSIKFEEMKGVGKVNCA